MKSHFNVTNYGYDNSLRLRAPQYVNRRSNFDPLERRVLAVALAPSELVGVAEMRERGFGSTSYNGTTSH